MQSGFQGKSSICARNPISRVRPGDDYVRNRASLGLRDILILKGPMRLQSLPILLMIFPALAGEINTGGLDERYYYRLTNSYLGDAYSLDTAPDGPNAPVVAKSGNSAGQYWKFTFHDGYYRLTNVLLGADLSLDTYSDGTNAPLMAQSGTETGQRWHVIRLGDGYVRLTNDYLGNSRSLDTHSDAAHTPFMGQTSRASGQLWKITKLARQ